MGDTARKQDKATRAGDNDIGASVRVRVILDNEMAVSVGMEENARVDLGR